jgi:hypothetical protein
MLALLAFSVDDLPRRELCGHGFDPTSGDALLQPVASRELCRLAERVRRLGYPVQLTPRNGIETLVPMLAETQYSHQGWLLSPFDELFPARALDELFRIAAVTILSDRARCGTSLARSTPRGSLAGLARTVRWRSHRFPAVSFEPGSDISAILDPPWLLTLLSSFLNGLGPSRVMS